MLFTVKSDVPESTDKGASRLAEQLDRLAAEGWSQEDMIVFPISASSGALSELSRVPGIGIDRIGPDVVRIRRQKLT
jgi:predicted DNA-binding helix-hairpin-helix protein